MFGDQAGFDPVDDMSQTPKMGGVEPVGTAQRQTHAVQRDRVVAANRVEIAWHRAAAHVVFGMHLEPRDIGTRLGDRLMVPKAQPDAGFRRDSAWRLLRYDHRNTHTPVPAQLAFSLPPWILLQSPAGSSTKDFASRACVA